MTLLLFERSGLLDDGLLLTCAAHPGAGRQDEPALHVAAGHEGHDLADAFLGLRQRALPVPPPGRSPLHALTRRPVLAVGEVPELHGVAGVEPLALPRLRREQPGALDPGAVRC